MFSRKNTRNFTKGVRIDLDGNKVTVDITIVVDYGSPVPEAVAVCAEKASFSAHEISPPELKTCLALLNGQIKSLYPTLSLQHRLWIKYGKGYL